MVPTSPDNRGSTVLGPVSLTSVQGFQFVVEILLEVSKTCREHFYRG